MSSYDFSFDPTTMLLDMTDATRTCTFLVSNDDYLERSSYKIMSLEMAKDFIERVFAAAFELDPNTAPELYLPNKLYLINAVRQATKVDLSED